MESSKLKVLVTICARKGSKGLPNKNIKPLLGKPLIAHTIDQARRYLPSTRVLVSTDSNEIAQIARIHHAEVPFLRPAELATDTAGKLDSIVHALEKAESHFNEVYDFVIDLDPTSPIRTKADFDNGLKTFTESGRAVCFSVVRARKNPYFNMVERDQSGKISLVKQINRSVASRQAAPVVWDMNASIYFFSRTFLKSSPNSLWEADCEIFEMPAISAFDIDQERDFFITEMLLKTYFKDFINYDEWT